MSLLSLLVILNTYTLILILIYNKYIHNIIYIMYEIYMAYA